MQQKYYIDTCICRDYFENRADRFRPLGEWAFAAIRKIVTSSDHILYSDIVVRELSKAYAENKIQTILSIIPSELLFKVDFNRKQAQRARAIASKYNIPFEDAVHAVLARDAFAILVTRDKHFLLIENGPIIKLPEDLL